jgi:hypothetical protein
LLKQKVAPKVAQKVAQKVAMHLSYLILSKNLNEPPKIAQLAKNSPIWSPDLL